MLGKETDEYVTDYLTQWATGLSQRIRQNLVSKDQWFDQSTLAQSIIVMPVEVIPDGYKVTIQMPDYAQYVDQGRGATKTGSRSLGSTVQRKLAGSSGWIARRAIPPPMQIMVKRKNSKGETKTYVKRFKNVNEANRSLSFAISRSIHKYGYKSKGHGFYSEIFNEDELQDLSIALAPVIGEAVDVTILEDIE